MFGIRLFRTLAFRIVLAYLALFAVSAAALVAFTYWNTRRTLDAETDQTIEAEIAGLSEQYQRQGLGGLTDVLTARSMHASQGLYLLVGPLGRPLAGNLDAWPTMQSSAARFVEFDYQRRVAGIVERHPARGRVFRLTGGFRLLVGRDIQERRETERLFTTALPWSVILMLTLGLVGGALMSRNLLRRLDSINSTSREIMAGHLSRRLPLSRAGDEFDTLARNLNRMLDRIERLMKGMREVTDSVAHDLRSPLNRLRNRLEGILRRISPEDREAGEIEAAIAETDRLMATFDSLLLIAEAEAGAARNSMTQVDLSALAHDVWELYAPVAEESGIALEMAPLNGPLRVRGNGNLLSQALANLVDNAIKYTPAGGKVRIAAQRNGVGAVLSVADNGPGIPAEDRPRVIERFVRLEASRHSPGTGLGLSLVAAVARLHEAQLELSDNRPGLKASMVFA
ncbi:MAG TPA: HAMP domain-containing sensor histidine kinase [Rhizomicrobium sp.]|nr:HAMP domain-containing sensor histidine kinase [Rhizomicrobium sp.]